MENVIIHIAVKGEKGAYIFHDDEDRYLYLRAMRKSSYKFNIKFLAYAILNNHAHFVIMGNKDTVSKFLYSGSRRFGTYYREKYKTSGRLFSGRVTKKYITSEIDLRNVIRYVNMNLVNAGIEKNIGDSIFSSYPAVLSLVSDPFERTEAVDNYTNKEELKFISGTLDIKYILKSFALNKNSAVKN